MTPPASSRCADASERARPTTSCPAPSSSGTTAEPIQPDAPVTKILMVGTSGEHGDVSDCYQHRSDVSDCQRLGWGTWVDGSRTVAGGCRKRLWLCTQSGDSTRPQPRK